jgi:hypothetical protein
MLGRKRKIRRGGMRPGLDVAVQDADCDAM